MRIAPPPRRTGAEPLLPMIDVVFFLVIFFMLASRLAAPEPFAVALPQARSAGTEPGPFTLFLSAEGEAGRVRPEGVLRGAPALASLAGERAAFCASADCRAEPPPVLLYTDAAAPAVALAALLPDLAAMGFAEVRLVTETP